MINKVLCVNCLIFPMLFVPEVLAVVGDPALTSKDAISKNPPLNIILKLLLVKKRRFYQKYATLIYKTKIIQYYYFFFPCGLETD